MKVVLSPNPYRDKGLKAAIEAEAILRAAGAKTCMCLPFDLGRDKAEIPPGLEFLPVDEALKGADVLVCFGGDGTILHAAKSAQAHRVPILGVNLGSVGFMAELESGELDQLRLVVEGRYRLEDRMMLEVTVRREGRVIHRDMALNDAVVTKGAVARIIDLDVKADGVLVSRFSGDGVVVSTPTGSTAYSMSAGGPIVEPTSENIAVTPICPHALYARSYILDRSRLVTIVPGEHSRRTAYLSVDGSKAFRLAEHDQVELRRARGKARLVRLTDRSFYTVLNQKLGRR